MTMVFVYASAVGFWMLIGISVAVYLLRNLGGDR